MIAPIVDATAGHAISPSLDNPTPPANVPPVAKAERPIKHFVIPLVMALGVYVVAYSAIEHRRTRKGPWEVTFTNSASGPMIVVNHLKLGISNVQISFPGETAPATNAPGPVDFRNPRPVPYDVPLGKCLFMDTTFLPGTLTFNLFGHEIELLPRVMVIDHDEHPWRSGELIELRRPAAGVVR